MLWGKLIIARKLGRGGRRCVTQLEQAGGGSAKVAGVQKKCHNLLPTLSERVAAC